MAIKDTLAPSSVVLVVSDGNAIMQGIAGRLKSRMLLAASGQAPDTRPVLIFAEVLSSMPVCPGQDLASNVP